ncbi:hypothetical protein B0A55_02429 [Friedmanniomyces simplex]|uniref:IBR domain-containing protein n=1 Tax=Friedmanniomyces simplex TaxID=329884 RepID=A0A4V5NJZ7_9PEZI|nr:hypothetical protein B0A55_02429 [Friedmanniomyces simplex]
MSCMTCAEPIPGEAWRHVCDPSKLRSTNDNDDDTFADLQRGRDYQICPSKRCGRKIQLKDGCNHVHCYCGAQFCYICGEATTHHSDHWRETCPRYNQPGARNAQFDPRLHPRLQRDREHNEGARDPRVTAPLSREADMARLFALGRVLTLNPGGNRGRGEQVDAMRHTAVLRVAGIPPP